MQQATSEPLSSNAIIDTQFFNARRLFIDTYNAVCRTSGDPNIVPFLHVTLVFVYHLTFCPGAMAHLASHFS